MGWKEFIKPNWRKILLLIIILLPALLISYNESDCMMMGGGCTHSEGFPFAYHSIHEPAAFPDNPPSPTESSNYFAIVLDIIFWYLIACLLFYIYSKIKGKKKN